MKILRSALLGASAVACAVSATPAYSANFILTSLNPGTAVGTQARAGFEIAAAYWSSVLTDNVTIRLNIGFSSLGAGILGSTGSTRRSFLVENAYSSLAADAKSSLDLQAVSGLTALQTSTNPVNGAAGEKYLAAITNDFANPITQAGYSSTATRYDNDGSINNIVLNTNTSVLKALGRTTDDDGNSLATVSDGSVQFSTNFLFDFDARDGIDSDKFDFVGVAIHEIGHALGFVSGVDTYDVFSGPNGPNAACFAAGTCAGLAGITSLENDFRVMSTLDLFRYSADGVLDWSTGGTKYFSIDGGETQFLGGDARFSTGSFNGDGRQASHFKDSASGVPQIGILDPTSARGQLQEVTAFDLGAFDAMGWDIGLDVLQSPAYRMTTADIFRYYVAAVPEPATWAMMIAGFGFVGAAARRRQSVNVKFA
jgi:hypothetical protein